MERPRERIRTGRRAAPLIITGNLALPAAILPWERALLTPMLASLEPRPGEQVASGQQTERHHGGR